MFEFYVDIFGNGNFIQLVTIIGEGFVTKEIFTADEVLSNIAQALDHHYSFKVVAI